MTLASQRGDGIASADMPVLKVNDQRYSLRPGANRLGAGDDVDVRLEGHTTPGIHAIVDVVNDAHVVIHPATASPTIRINGILLGEPTPLVHGDKLEIAGNELHYSDETKAGVTERFPAASMTALAAERELPTRVSAPTGGRLVSLVDGKEYSIPQEGLVIGRDASCGVVVPHNKVSRKHAEIVPGELGYTLKDLSANGVKVNGARVNKTKLLGRSDTIKVGPEEFRFYSDVPTRTPRGITPVKSAAAKRISSQTTAVSSVGRLTPETHAPTKPLIRTNVRPLTKPASREERSPLLVSVLILAVGAATAFFLLKR